MNVLGEGFPNEIIKQIDVRQSVYGSGLNGTRTADQINYLNGNTSWCKLISATNIENVNSLNIPSIKNLGLTGDQLAKEFVLFNGTSFHKSGIDVMRGGITSANSWSGDRKAYGIGTNEFGIKPMPGIQSVEVTHENRGSIRQATVKLKAWNRFQFEIIDVLYLRLGFSVLLEWGHATYFDNAGVFHSSGFNFSLSDEFLNGKYNYNSFLGKISEQRIKSLGNYDAMFAKVKNFSWSFQKDGSYDVTISLISSGDIIESLKINAIVEDPLTTEAITSGDTAVENTGERPEVVDKLIPFYARKNTIGYFLYWLWSILSKNTPYSKELTSGIADNAFTFSFSDLPGGDVDLQTLGLPTVGSKTTSIKFNKNDFEQGYIDAINWEFDAYDSDGGDEQYFVRLGAFLAFLQNYLMPRCTGGDSGVNGEPLLKFDYTTEDNIFALHKWQVSEDPRIAIVGRNIAFPPDGSSIEDPSNWEEMTFYRYNTPIENAKLGVINGVEYGNIMNVYLNFKFIIQKIDELKDDKNKLSLFDLLKGICEGINTALGGLNNFEPIIDENTNTIKIIDQNPLPNKEEILKLYSLPEELAMFYLYGYTGDKAGFIKDFNFATEITPELATMITVGASANGSVVGENSTALSKLNVGLKDRYKEEVVDKVELDKRKTTPPSSTEDELKAMKERYANTIEGYYAFLDDMEDDDLDINSDDIDAYKGTLKNLIDFELQLKQKKAAAEAAASPSTTTPTNAPGTGFIPFNLSVTMDGLSGMKIYSKFTIDTQYLPSNYPDSVEFLIKGITHTIDNNKWNTKLESFCVSKGKFDTINPVGTTTTTTTNNQQNNSPGNKQSNTNKNQKQPPFIKSSVPIVPGSKLRQAIVKWAFYYYNQNIWEIAQDQKFVFGKNGTKDATDFQKDMKSVGWGKGAAWCNFFSKLVWKQAYIEVGNSDPVIANVRVNTFKDFDRVSKGPVTGYVPTTYSRLKKLGAVEDFKPKVTKIYPGDYIMYDWVGTQYTYDHIGLCVESDNNARTLKTIGGNEGGPGHIQYKTKNMDKSFIKAVARPIEK